MIIKNNILEEIYETLEKIGSPYYEIMDAALRKTGRIFIAGKGRSGLVGKCFAMRLRHLGMESYVAGETICPPIKKGDLLMIISCSGNRETLIELARKTGQTGGNILCITSGKSNKIAKMADKLIVIPSAKSSQFGNSLFEQSVFLFLENFVENYRENKRIPFADMAKKHANLE